MTNPTLFSLIIDWMDGDRTQLDNVSIYKIDYENKFATIVYKEDKQTCGLVVNLLSVYSIVSVENKPRHNNMRIDNIE